MVGKYVKRLACIGLLLPGFFSASQAADLTFYSYGDSHYGSLDPKTNWVHQINALSGTAYPAALGGGSVDPARGILALGDLINDGGNLTKGIEQWADWKADYGVNGEGICIYPVYECFGNHDLSSTRFVQQDVIVRNQLRPGLTAISPNGLHYSWDWDGVHFVALGIYPADTWIEENNYGPAHDPEYALEFLKWDLANNVGDSGRPVITLHHYDFLTDWWPDRQKLAYPRELDGYNIILILHGHQGAPYSYNWQGYTVSGQNGSLNVGRITPDNQLALGTRTGQNTWGNTFTKSVTFPDLGRTWNPVPRNGHKNVLSSITQLAWRPGAYALTQDFYFGTSSNVVENSTAPDITALAASVSNAPIPAAFLPLQPGTEYFWRVDQHNGTEPFSKGKIWSFRTKEVITTNDITFLVESDIHYDALTLTANKRRLQAMNAIPGTPYPAALGGSAGTPRGVVFGGDAADDARQWQYDYYLADHGLTGEHLLEYPVTGECNGNHDGGLGSIVANGIIERNTQKTYLTGLSTNGLHCSWDWDQVHCVTLGVRPGANTNPYNSHGSLEFLIEDLATRVGTSGRAVVLFQHFGLDAYAAGWWTEAERNAYYEAIKNYNVIAIFHGHTHTTSIYQWRGIDVYNAPHMSFAGSVSVPVTSSQGFFTAHITSNRLDVAEMKADGTWGISSSKPIYLSYALSGLPAVVANGSASNSVPGEATLSGVLTYQNPDAGPTDVTIYWGTENGATNELAWAHSIEFESQSTGSFSAEISGVGFSQTLYYRCRASNSQGLVWAPDSASFITGPAVVVDNGIGATEITRTAARLSGNLLQTVADPTETSIFWGPTDGGTSQPAWSNSIALGTTPSGPFSTTVEGLSPDTRYYYRCYATNNLGQAWAADSATLLTLSDRPTVSTQTPSSVSRQSAVLNGFLISTGSAPTTVSAYLGTVDGGTDPGAWERSVTLGECREGDLSLLVTGLNEAQQYYYRFFASNTFGVAWADTGSSFKTWSSSGPIDRWDAALFSTGDYNTTGSGSFTWNDPTAWVGGSVPNATNAVISLEPRTDLGDTLITVDNTCTVGSITARQSGQATRFTGSGKLIFSNGADEAVLNVHRRQTRYTTLRADIYVDMQLNSDLDLRIGAARQDEADCGRIGRTISGSGALTLTLGINEASATRLFKLAETGANSYQGGTTIRHISRISYGTGHGVQNIVQLNAVSTGAFGTGDVTLDGTGCTTTCLLPEVGAGRGMWVRLSASDAVANGATLHLLTASKIALELAAGTSQTLATLNVDDTPVANGTYTGGDFDWLYGTGTLTITDAAPPPPAQEPDARILGSNRSIIANGSTVLSQPLGTDFGEILWNGGPPLTHTFTITNSGTATLSLSGAPVDVLSAHSADFTVTQPAASTIAAGGSVTFTIACDPSALGIRTGLVSIASNDSDRNPYTFRIQGTGTAAQPPLPPPPTEPVQLTFQQGDGGAYSETAATWIEERNGADDNHGSDAVIPCEEEYRASTTTHLLTQGLLGYFNIIGNRAGQIPPGATINSATLTLKCNDAGAGTTPVTLHRMLKEWVEDEATWTLRKTGSAFGNGPFVATTGNPVNPGGGEPGVDYVATEDDSRLTPVGSVIFDITSVVQAWANGAGNYGVYLRYRNTNMARFHSDDAETQSDRPLLTVIYAAAVSAGTVLLLQ